MKYIITSHFGSIESFREKPHSGIDFQMEAGTKIYSIKNGIIHLADYGSTNAGKTIFVEWENGQTAIYGHLSKFAVTEGQKVKAGDLLGYSGNTGNSTGAHLHFGLKENGQFIDPSPYINQIQHMNDATQQIVTSQFNFSDFFHQHMNIFNDMLSNLKIYLINLIASSDYSPFIELLKNIV